MVPDVRLRSKDGGLLPIAPARWHGRPTAADELVLRNVAPPVLDVGCGPGRVLHLLAQRGATVLGVDPAPGAVALARRRGCVVLQRSVFDRLPLERRWGTVLLLDGNVGIGGDPAALLARVRDLVRPGGRLLAEAAPYDVDERLTVRVEDADGRHGPPFPWARLGTTALLYAACSSGWVLTGRWTAGGRPFVELHRPGEEHSDAPPTATERPAHP